MDTDETNRSTTRHSDDCIQNWKPNSEATRQLQQSITQTTKKLKKTGRLPENNGDLHSTTNVHTVLGKLPTPCRLEWNRFTLQHHIRQPSPLDLSEWFSDYAKACTILLTIHSAHTDDRKSASRPNFNPPRQSSEKLRSETQRCLP